MKDIVKFWHVCKTRMTPKRTEGLLGVLGLRVGTYSALKFPQRFHETGEFNMSDAVVVKLFYPSYQGSLKTAREIV